MKIDLFIFSWLGFTRNGCFLLKLDLQPGRKIRTIFWLLIKSSLLLPLPHHLIHDSLSVQLTKIISEDDTYITGTSHAANHNNF